MVTIKNLVFGYSRKEPLLNNLSLEIDSGHIYSILGSNGTGKSTLLKIICGLLTPQSGSVTTLGMIPDQRRPSMYSELFVIPEEFEMPSLTLRRYVAANAPLYPHFSGEAFAHYTGEFDLLPDTRLDRLSMGQKKRALIAFALACRPALLIMDEPTNGLDITAKGVFRRLLASYADEQHTVILSTHQVRDIENLIDHLLILDGRGRAERRYGRNYPQTVFRVGERGGFTAVPGGDAGRNLRCDEKS